jgi:hypothetical protein
MKKLILAGAFFFAFLCASILSAQEQPPPEEPQTKPPTIPMERYLPADVLYFLKVRNASSLPDYFKKSPVYRIWQEKDVQSVFEEPFGKVKKRFEESVKEIEDEAGLKLKDILDTLKGEITFTLIDLEMPQAPQPVPGAPAPVMQPPGTPKFKLVFSADVGDKKDEFIKLLETVQDKAIKESGEDGVATSVSEHKGHKIYSLGNAEIMFNATWLGTRWVLSLDKTTLHGVLDRYLEKGATSDSLEADKNFATVYAKCGGGREEFFFYNDMSTLAGKFKDQIPPDAGKLLADMGFFEDMVSGYGGLLEPDGTSRELSYALLTEEHKMLDLVGKSKIDTSLYVPSENIILWLSASYDLTESFNYVMNFLSTSLREQGKDVAEELKELEETLGFKLEEEFIKSLSSKVNFYVMLPQGGGAFPELALTASIANGELLNTAVSKFVDKMGEELKTTEYQGKKLYYFSIDKFLGEETEVPYWPTFTLAGNMLLVGSGPQVVKRMIGNLEKPVAPTGNLKLALSKTPKDSYQFVYVDAKLGFSYVYNTILPFMHKKHAESFPEFLDPAKLPPVEVLVKHMSYIYSFAAKDEKGSYGEVVSPAGPLALPALGALIGAAAAIPSALPMGPRGIGPAPPKGVAVEEGEAAALSHLRVLSSAQELYNVREGSYAANLEALAEINLIDKKLATGIVSGYMFDVQSDGPTKWHAVARPLVPGEERRYFYIDQTGIIRVSKTPDIGPESPPHVGK